MQHRGLVIALGAVLATILGCSDSNGGFVLSVEPLVADIDFGLVRGDAPTTKTLTLVKPFVPSGDVALVGAASGPFAPAPGQVPREVNSGIEYELDVVFTPPAGAATAQSGGFSGAMTLRFTKSDRSLVMDVVLNLTAQIETPRIELATPSIDFGKCALGERALATVVVRNPNLVTPIELLGASALPPGFSHPANTARFPAPIGPQRTRSIGVLYAPTAEGDDSFSLEIENSVGDPVTVSVRGTAIPGEVVVDFGSVDITTLDLDNFWFTTPELQVDLPPEAISMTIELSSAGTFDYYTPLQWTAPDGSVYVDPTDPHSLFSDVSPWFNYPEHQLPVFPVFYLMPGRRDPVFQLPNSDHPDAQLVAGGGTYRFRVGAWYGDVPAVDIRVVIEQRGKPASKGTLDLNVFVANGIPVTVGTAPTDNKIQELLQTMDLLYSQVGLRIGDVAYYKLADPALDDITTESEFETLQSRSAVATDARLNLFLVRSIGGDFSTGTLGVAGAIPGKKANGTPTSGVMLAYDGVSGMAAGSTAAHEGGHFLGLWHTTQFDGSSSIVAADPILDTPVCDAFPTPACPTQGNDNLLWPYDLAISDLDYLLTPGQGHVLLRHTLVGPGTPDAASSSLAAHVSPAALASALQDLGPPSEWCATCRKIARE